MNYEQVVHQRITPIACMWCLLRFTRSQTCEKKAMPTVSVDVEQRKSVVSAAVTHISIVTKQHDIVQLLFSLSVNETYERGILQ